MVATWLLNCNGWVSNSQWNGKQSRRGLYSAQSFMNATEKLGKSLTFAMTFPTGTQGM
jgi:hypothetical protein